MSKRVTNAVQKVLEARFGMNKARRYVACDDGSTYVFERPADGRRWVVLARYDRDGSRSTNTSRLPAAIEAHADGFTRSGPVGADSDEYWV